MEVRKGYKQTEVGIVPEDWEIKTFKDICWVNQGLQIVISSRLKHPTPKSKLYITIQFLNNGKEVEYIDEYSSSVCCGKDDILMTRTGNTGIVVSGVEGVFHNNFFKINYDKNLIDKDFFIYYLNQEKTQKTILIKAGTSTIPDLNHNDFYSISIPLPPLPEQHAIAAALSDVDALLNSLDALIAKKRLIKQGAMQELLTGKKRLPGFGEIWEVKKLKDLVILSKAGINPASSPDTLFAHFSLPAFDAGAVPIFEKGSQIGSNKFLVPDNAVLISKLNPRIPRVWAPVYVPENAICSTEFLVLIPQETIDQKFLAVLCWSPTVSYQMELHAIGTTGSHQRINPLQALKIEVNVPKDKTEQTAIAEILSDMDAEISALEQKREKTRLLKQGMMQELLTGRIRLL